MNDGKPGSRIWDPFLTERDKEVFKTSGFGAKAGFGKRPALLVIDVSYGFAGDKPEPILESINREDGWDVGSWAWKNTRTGESLPKPTQKIEANDIVAEIAPQAQDVVIHKQKPSGFFGTNLSAYLTLLGADSVIVTGTTTSGCVRATVIDAFSQNFRVAVAEDGCFDRSQASHAINLCDMHAKYADVVPAAEVLAFIATLGDDLFPSLPKGSSASEPPHLRLVSSA